MAVPPCLLLPPLGVPLKNFSGMLFPHSRPCRCCGEEGNVRAPEGGTQGRRVCVTAHGLFPFSPKCIPSPSSLPHVRNRLFCNDHCRRLLSGATTKLGNNRCASSLLCSAAIPSSFFHPSFFPPCLDAGRHRTQTFEGGRKWMEQELLGELASRKRGKGMLFEFFAGRDQE